jgi:hypothetical protein
MNNMLKKHNFEANPTSFYVGVKLMSAHKESTQITDIVLQEYRVYINYRSILQNHIFTSTEQKYIMLLQFERGVFAVS